jgi:hypothetical protein
LADFSLGLFAGFSLNIINFAGRISEAAILASVVHWKDPLGPILGFFAGFSLYIINITRSISKALGGGRGILYYHASVAQWKKRPSLNNLFYF